MNSLNIETAPSAADIQWTPFPGGELEGAPARPLCPKCRAELRESSGAVPARTLCFQCYLLDMRRNAQLKAAAALDTASDGRFQSQLPFEPVNHTRLAALKVERQAARVAARTGRGGFVEKRRRAQIEARHALAAIVRGVTQRVVLHGTVDAASAAHAAQGVATRRSSSRRVCVAAAVPADAQMPASWLPFVAAR